MAHSLAPRLAARAIFLLLIAALLLPAPARAQGSLPASLSKSKRLPLDITADQIDYLSKDDVYTAEGNVKITQQGRRLNANWVLLDVDSRIGVASGNVRLSDGKDVVSSEFMEFNIDTLVGVIYRGRFDAKETGFKITGNEIRRLADKEYRLDEGTFTTCDCGPGKVPSWRIEGDRVDVTVDGYAKVRGTKFKVRDTPVAYIPYGIFPVKTTRQSGLLFPAIGNSSRNGFEFNLPYYWAISENTDATFYQDFLSKRGLKEGVEFRYIFQPETYGQANVWYLDDKDVTSDDPFGPSRWAVRWEALSKLPWGIRGRSDVQNVSDNAYVIDFNDLGRDSSRYLESRGQIYKAWDAGIVALGAIHGDDLQSPDDLDRDKVVLNRYPYLNADLIDQKASTRPCASSGTLPS
jgi:LPS-assembly protein